MVLVGRHITPYGNNRRTLVHYGYYSLILFRVKYQTPPCKVYFVAMTIKRRGLLISSKGVRVDPRGLDGLLSMADPHTGVLLQQLLCALE